MTLELVAPFGAGRTPVVAQNRAEETGRYDATLFFFLLGRGMLGLLPIVGCRAARASIRPPRTRAVHQPRSQEHNPAADRAWPPAAPRAWQSSAQP
ncbi:hypothetical protein [Streptomyces griseorubiginosus]|uniref:hypothetical protein n=1 Tax=Streptomyces griseorubiginosus TaxID=67304 RepID=UPI0033220D19